MSTASRTNSATMSTGRAATGDLDAQDHEFCRGHEDGMAWAEQYATHDEARDLAERYEEADPASEDPYWRGFAEGVEDVLDVTG